MTADQIVMIVSAAITAAATIVIAIYTRTVWVRAREIERAYLAGGGDFDTGRDGQFVVDANGARVFRVEVENHGKTPARVYAFDIKFDTLAEVRKRLKDVDPSANEYDDSIPPGGRKYVLGLVAATRSDADVVYGAFWYRDIWHKRRMTRFILSVESDGHTKPNATKIDDHYKDWT